MPLVDYKLTKEAQENLVKLVNSTFETANSHLQELRTKMEVVDVMYARYSHLKEAKKAEAAAAGHTGIDAAEYAYAKCQDEYKELGSSFTQVNIPMLVSQVDTAVAYLAEIYLSGSPIFPVVSDVQFRKTAEYIETLVDKYSAISAYPRELLMFFRDAVKYNYAPVLNEWDLITEWESQLDNTDLENAGEFTLRKNLVGYHKIKRTDPYNTIYDFVVNPGDCARNGEFSGYTEILTQSALSNLISRLESLGTGYLMNQSKVFDDTNGFSDNKYYNDHPQISSYVTKKREFSWDLYFEMAKATQGKKSYKGLFQVCTLFRRIQPLQYGIKSPDTEGMKAHEYKLYKLIVINGNKLLYAEPLYTAYESLPLLIGSPMEDGLGLQTKSLAESTIPLQQAVDTLTNIRFHSARRAISDRALYDRTAIDPQHVNSPNPSAKIPVLTNRLAKKSLSEAYYSIPYDGRGTDGVIRDALTISQWSNELNGLNRAQQGQFQEGNKTREEFNTIMSNAEMRQRLPAITLEFQVFQPMKQLMKLNISRFAKAHKLRSMTSGKEVEMDLNTLRTVMYDFRMGDGYNPSNKLASVDVLTAGMQMLSSSEPLQLAYGTMLPNMFSHLMQLGGVRGVDNYLPQQQPQGTPNEQTTEQPEPGAGPAGAGGDTGLI